MAPVSPPDDDGHDGLKACDRAGSRRRKAPGLVDNGIRVLRPADLSPEEAPGLDDDGIGTPSLAGPSPEKAPGLDDTGFEVLSLADLSLEHRHHGKGGWRERLRRHIMAPSIETPAVHALRERLLAPRVPFLLPMGGEAGELAMASAGDSPSGQRACRRPADRLRYRNCPLEDAFLGWLHGILPDDDMAKLVCFCCRYASDGLLGCVQGLMKRDLLGGERLAWILEIVSDVCRSRDLDRIVGMFGAERIRDRRQMMNWFEVEMGRSARLLFNRSLYYFTRGNLLDVLEEDPVQFNALVAFLARLDSVSAALPLAIELQAARDWNSLVALVSALPAGILSDPGMEDFARLCSPHCNYQHLRKAHQRGSGVPWLGVYARDLVFCQDAFSPCTSGIVNWRAVEAVGSILADLLARQRQLR